MMRKKRISAQRVGGLAVNTVVSIPLLLLSLITIALFAIIIWSSFKSYDAILSNMLAPPTSFSLDNYVTLFARDNFGIYLLNSLLITGGSVFTVLYVSTLASYGITCFQYKGSGTLLFYFMVGLMLPAQLGIVPLYVLIRGLRLTNTIFSMMLIGAAGVSMPIFVMSSFMRAVPGGLIESARIDGASEIRIFHSIILPLVKAPLGALIPLMVIGSWNDFLMPIIFLTNDKVKTVTLGVMKYYNGQYLDLSKLNLVFTAATVSIMPIMTIYLLANKKIVGGITDGAIKQ